MCRKPVSLNKISPSIEWTVSKATILGSFLSTCLSSISRWSGSLWRKMCFLTPLLRIPWIIDAWFPESEKNCTPKGKTCKWLLGATERKLIATEQAGQCPVTSKSCCQSPIQHKQTTSFTLSFHWFCSTHPHPPFSTRSTYPHSPLMPIQRPLILLHFPHQHPFSSPLVHRLVSEHGLTAALRSPWPGDTPALWSPTCLSINLRGLSLSLSPQTLISSQLSWG